MKLRILKSATLPGVGTFRPGTVVVISNDVAEGWLRSGKARVEDGTPWIPGVEPKATPKPKAKAKPKTQIEPDPVPVSEPAVAPGSGPES